MSQRQITEVRFRQWSERIYQSSQAVGRTQSRRGANPRAREGDPRKESTRSQPVSMATEAEVLLGHNSVVFPAFGIGDL